MNENPKSLTSRREFLRNTGKLAAASALAGVTLPHVHAAHTDTLRIAFIGNGSRGTGAIANAFSTRNQGPIKLVSMADIFPQRQNSSYAYLKKNFHDLVDVPEDRRFIGFDAYKKAMDCVGPGDIAVFTTPLAFRWVDFTYAIKKGLNVFMEKPLVADGPTARRMFKLADEASNNGLKVGVGLMSRHARHLQQLHQRIQDGEIGDVILMRGYRMAGPIGNFQILPKPPGITDLLYQIKYFHAFMWTGGGCYSDFYIHHIDELCWMKNAWPIKAQGVGGRQYKKNAAGIRYVDQNFDSYGVEYTFADGSKMFHDGRQMAGCLGIYSSYVHGSKGVAIAAASGDCNPPSSTYRGQNTDPANRIWISKDNSNPYDNEWHDLIHAIRTDQPYNEVHRGVQASLVTSMGRMAAHTGQEITYDRILNDTWEYSPHSDQFTMTSDSPLMPDAHGMYPKPEPGEKGYREY